MFRKFILILLMLFATSLLFSQEDIIQIKLKNTDKKRAEFVSGKILEINFPKWFLVLQTDDGLRKKIPFVSIRLTDLYLYKLLVKLADSDPDNLFEAARVMKYLEKIESAERMFKNAIKAGFTDNKKIEGFNAELREQQAQEIIKTIKNKISRGNLTEARRSLNKLDSVRFEETIAFESFDELENLITQAELKAKKFESSAQKDMVELFTKALDDIDALLGEGHEMMALRENFGATQKWRDGIYKLEDKSGIIAELSKIAASMPENFLHKQLMKLKKRALEILTALYKSMIVFYLTADSFPGAREYLNKAVKIAPLDREILAYWYIYDEYKPVITTVKPETSDNPDEK